MPGSSVQVSIAERVTGCAVAAAALGSLLMVMHHPVVPHHDTAELVQGIREQAAHDRLVHGVLSVTSGVLTAGALTFSARLGMARRPHVLAGALAVSLSMAFTCLAVMLDGFVAPALAERCGAGSACAGSVGDLLLMGALQIDVLTRYAIFATAAATGFWAADLAFRRNGSKVVGAIGAISSAAQLWLLFAVTSRFTPRELALAVVAQGAWYLSVGALMMFGGGPYSGAVAGEARS